MDEKESSHMAKLRIIFIASLVIMGVLVALTVFRPMVLGEKLSVVSHESIIETEDEWIIEVAIINREGEDTRYIFNWSTGGKTYSEGVWIKDGHKFKFIYHAYPETVKEGKVHLAIYKKGEATPFEECTYYISFGEQ